MQAAAAILSGFALIAGYVESEHYRVPAIQDSYNSLIERLNMAARHWGVMISRVREHQQTLVESERKWLQLQSEGRRSTSIGRYILGTTDEGTAQNLQRKFVQVLDGIILKCDDYSNSVAIDR